jgi:hypothetical protein
LVFSLSKIDFIFVFTCAGFVCMRGFDRKSRAPRPLYPRLHFPASKITRNKKSATSAAVKDDEKNARG